MRNKVKTMEEAYRVFDLLGIKEVTKKWQKNKGTEVWELPQKTMYYNGRGNINRFSIYRSGYVRKMVVYGKNNASMSCYQLNKQRKEPEYFKDYKWNDNWTEQTWTGKYRKRNSIKRILIDNHKDRIVYLCNYILKNYYNNSKMSLVGDYTRLRVSEINGKFWRNERKQDDLPFEEKLDLVSKTFTDTEVRVLINGHRYILNKIG